MTLFDDLLRQLDAPTAEYARLDNYYAGTQPLSFLSPEAKTALGNRLSRVSVNVPALLVNAVAERLRVTGFDNADVWDDWLANDLDQASGMVHRDALVLGTSYVLVWGTEDGRPNVTAESAKQVSVQTDPATRQVTAALKRWSTDSTTEASLFEPHVVTRLRADVTGATSGGFRVVKTTTNPLGQVPVVPFVNSGRLLGEGRSEMSDVLSLTDALVKILADMLVSSEYTARPRRWATGIELEEDDDGNAVNPIPETNKAMTSENPDAKFGQLAGSDLAGYENATGILMRQISAVSGLPEHMLGIGGDNPTSADSIRASEAALTARAEARQKTFGRSWEQVARLMARVRGADADPRIQWADPSTRSEAQQADAVVKLFQAGLLPAGAALARLGYSEAEVEQIRTARRADSLSSIDFGALS